jgi:fibronectin-binding autotransporter adhesin
MKPRLLSVARLSFPLASALAALLGLHSAQAASATWQGTTDATWAGANWSATPVPGTGETATFSGSAATVNNLTTIDLGAGVIINTLLFDTSSAADYIIGSGAAGSQTLNINNSGAITMNSTVAANETINAAVTLGTAIAGTYTFTNNSTTNSLIFGSTVAGGTVGTAAAKTLTVTGGGSTIFNGAIGNGGGGALSLVKSGAGTVTFGAANTYTGSTVLNGGTLSYTVDNLGIRALNFGVLTTSGTGTNNVGSTTVSTIDAATTPSNLTATSINVFTNSATANTINIGTGKTLTSTGGLTIGYNGSLAASLVSANSRLTVAGAGNFAITGGNVVLGVDQTTDDSGNESNAFLNLTGLLGSFTANVTNFSIGNNSGVFGSVLLGNGATNTIAATTLTVGHSQGSNSAGGTSTLTMGTATDVGTYTINADTINVGFSKASGNIKFFNTTAGAGSVTIANKLGTGPAAITLGSNNGTATATDSTGTLDLRGHTAMVNAGAVSLGISSAGSNTGNGIGVLHFDTGTFSAASLSIGRFSNAGAGSATAGTVNVGGGSFSVSGATTVATHTGTAASTVTAALNVTGGTFTTGSLTGANSSGATAVATSATSNINVSGTGILNTGTYLGAVKTAANTGTNTANINVSGGQFNVTGATFQLASQATAGSAVGLLNITGSGVVTSNADITVSGTNTSTITLNGATAVLDMTGKSIGGVGNLITNLNFQQGTLQNVLQINNGAGLTKTGAGTLTLSGTNSYTGNVTINTGTINLGAVENANVSGPLGKQLANAAGTIILNGGTLQYSAANQFDYSGRFSTAASQAYNVDTNGQTVTWATALTSSGGTLAKSGTGTLILSNNGSSHSGNATIAAGTVRLGVDNGISTASGIDIGSGAPTTATLDLNGFDQTLSRLVFTTANAGGNLTITGGSNSKLTINTTSNTELGAGGAVSAARDVAVDMSGLGELDWNGAANTFRVGLRSGATNSAVPGTFTTTLAEKNTITALALSVGDVAASGNGGTSILRLGQSNFLNANTINLGNGSRTNATLEFRSGLTDPTVKIRGTDGMAPVGTWEVGRVNHTSNVTWTALADFSAGELDASVTNLRIGVANTGASTGRAGTENATFTMGKGTLDVTSLIIGQYNGTNTGTVSSTGNYAGNGTFNLNDAAGKVTAGSVILADNIGLATGGVSRTTSGTFNLNAGTLEAKTIDMGDDTGNATATTRNFNFTGGTVRNIVGFDLAIANVPITLTGSGTRVFEATAGQTVTVASTAAIGEDAAGKGLTKSGTGTLVLASTSTYTGGTLVSAGTLLVTGSLTSDINVSDTATFGGGGTVGAVSFGGGSFFDIALAVGSADSLTSGAISFAAAGFGVDNLVFNGATVNWNTVANDTYTLLTGDLNSLNLDNFGLANAYDLGGGRSAYFQSGSLQLVVIPEPSVTALIGALGGILLLRRRR